MFDLALWLHALAALLLLGTVGWLTSVALRNVNLVDSLWSLKFLLCAVVYVQLAGLPPTPRGQLALVLVGLWALRLSVYLTFRNWGHAEDRRYVAIRANNSPGFWWKSAYIIFGLQALLAWVVSLPLLGAATSAAPLGWLDALGTGLWLLGMVYEAGSDWQLARFKRDPANAGRVLASGLWANTRHPNYFGNFCIWWGLYLVALQGGAWWSLPGPLLMTLLLMKVSGVALLEKDIVQRRPEYADYVRRTPAFIPGPRRP
jgi:steroid 5-alpha reductase family enzyme